MAGGKKIVRTKRVVLAALLALSLTHTGHAQEGFDNHPHQVIATPNNPVTQARKLGELRQWRQLQELYSSGMLTPVQYQARRSQLMQTQGGHRSFELASMGVAPSVILNVPAVAQVCKEYCGPASTYEMLLYSGNSSLSQSRIAALEGTGACTPTNQQGSGNAGTCAAPIRDALNRYYLHLPYANYFATRRLDHSSLTGAYNDYASIVDYSIGVYAMPFVQLLDAKPCGTGLALPGWESVRDCGFGHYIVTTGYEGLYDGHPDSRTIVFDDTAWWNPVQKHFDMEKIARMIYIHNGAGSCNDTNIIY